MLLGRRSEGREVNRNIGGEGVVIKCQAEEYQEVPWQECDRIGKQIE